MLTDEQKDRLRAWCAALRSGEFKQCKGALRREDERCCLGVACDVYMRDPESGPRLHWEHVMQGPDSYGIECAVPGRDDSTYIETTGLPEEVQKYFGLSLRDPVLSGDPLRNHLTCQFANDGLQWTFDEIAHAIEKRYLS